jgi:hypothetical protein
MAMSIDDVYRPIIISQPSRLRVQEGELVGVPERPSPFSLPGDDQTVPPEVVAPLLSSHSRIQDSSSLGPVHCLDVASGSLDLFQTGVSASQDANTEVHEEVEYDCTRARVYLGIRADPVRAVCVLTPCSDNPLNRTSQNLTLRD